MPICIDCGAYVGYPRREDPTGERTREAAKEHRAECLAFCEEALRAEEEYEHYRED